MLASSLHYTKIWGNKFIDLVYKKNTEFVIENEDEGIESLQINSYPDFDPSKFDSEDKAYLQLSENIVKSSNNLKNLDIDKSKNETELNSEVPFDSQNCEDYQKNKFTANTLRRKDNKEFRNRSSEFTKHNLHMVDYNSMNG